MLIAVARPRSWRSSSFAAALITLGLACVEEDTDGGDGDDEAVTTFADEGCSVVTCPEGIESCCTQTLAAVTDTVTAGYARRDDLIQAFTRSSEGVRMDVTFDAPEQSASIVFNLGTDRSFYAMQVTAARDGASETYVTAVVSDALRRGCVFGGDLPAAVIGEAALDAPREIELNSDEFCFNGGIPGRGSVIDFSFRATGPGAASLEIVDLELRSVGRID